ncbi:peptidase M14 carboxypeptidase A [Beutenbergia cavernae DSM 12333]|uniref:Peptidase M14 carboxypeptidase A n=1 Tax=Beutenbergia cavernae (strain ATCC BAA-8 / DSM 12333 / CCUG 43141 / JCM 11478 / NBRC 16432 / NCIMB 13614 / HKI 0122) TaxID=471853 RepID=C5C3J1_BEUC1|nr:M14 family zinc carboxypeptidase [Beutenbergia cavernae]ACQ81900.1 peptidase M14 carboxypeptidase A [Beutenbergia cavernae DSM 12333]
MSTTTTSAAPGRAPEWLADVVARSGEVPPTDVFPTVDELLASFEELRAASSGRLTRRRIGTSRLGEPIWCYSVGTGSRAHVIVGGVHPNEPIGSVTALHLARTAVEDRDLTSGTWDATWHVVPTIDPDGMRLNEGWLHGPFTRSHYSRHFYRPAPAEQVEWSFPLEYKDLYFDAVMPETLALMRLLDDTRPELLMTLHNGELGGVYYYLTEALPSVYGALAAIPEAQGLELDAGEPEAPFIPVLAPAIYAEIDPGAGYEHLVSLGLDPLAGAPSGGSSGSYASRHGTFSFVAELPYWSHPDSSDDSVSSHSYADALARAGVELGEVADLLLGLLAEVDGELPDSSPLVRGSRAFLPFLRSDADALALRAVEPEADRPATVAEVFSVADQVRMFRLRFGGMLLRAVDGICALGTASPTARRVHARLTDVLAEWGREADAHPLTPHPIAALAGVQYASLLAVSRALQDRARQERTPQRDEDPGPP